MDFDFFPAQECDDSSYVQSPKWRDRPITYQDGDEQRSKGWRFDTWERVLDVPGVPAEHVFQQARARLISMDVLPRDILTYTVQWQVEERLPQAGDLLFQRTHLLQFAGRYWLDVLSATRLGDVQDVDNGFMLQYIATEGHPERGFSKYAVINDGTSVRFTIETVSQPANWLTKLVGKMITRPMQLKITNAVLDYMQNSIRLDLSEEPFVA